MKSRQVIIEYYNISQARRQTGSQADMAKPVATNKRTTGSYFIARSRSCALPLKRLFRCFYVGPMVNFPSKNAMTLKFYQVIWTLRSFLGIQMFVTLLILFSVLYLHVWRKSSLATLQKQLLTAAVRLLECSLK